MTYGQTLPAATYQEPKVSSGSEIDHAAAQPTTTDGPIVNGRPTSITLLTPSQLVKHELLPSFNKNCNAAFRAVHIKTGVLPPDLPRLPQEDSILSAIGSALSSFTYVVHYAGTYEVIGTVSMRKYISIPLSTLPAGDPKRTFDRERPVPDDTEAWEVKLLTVAVDAQGQGLAVLLMDMAEAEAKRRFETDVASAASTGRVVPKHLVYVLSSIKQEYYGFYSKRGYKFDYDVAFPVGTLGSPKPFSIVHMSKPLGEVEV